MIDIDKLDKLYGPHKRYPFYFVENPAANEILDAVPGLIAEVRVGRALFKASIEYRASYNADDRECDALDAATIAYLDFAGFKRWQDGMEQHD